METKLHGTDIVELLDDTCIIRGIDDVFEWVLPHTCSSIIVKKENMAEGFFDLSTGIAGELLQKFATYRKRLAILGDYEQVKSKALRDFIYESNRTKQILFVKTKEEALQAFER